MAWVEQQIADLPERGVSGLVLRLVSRFEIEMKSQRMTKTELARRAGLNRAHLSRILNEPSNVTMGTLVSIANALDMALDVRAFPRHQQAWTLDYAKAQMMVSKPPAESLEDYREGKPFSLPDAA